MSIRKPEYGINGMPFGPVVSQVSLYIQGYFNVHRKHHVYPEHLLRKFYQVIHTKEFVEHFVVEVYVY